MQKQKLNDRSFEQVLLERTRIVGATDGSRLQALTVRPEITNKIADAQDALYELICAWQQDVTSAGNVTVIGPTLLAAQQMQRLFDQFAQFGLQDRLAAKAQTNQTDNDD